MSNDLIDIVTEAEVAVALDYYKQDLVHTDIGELVNKLKYRKYEDESQRKEYLNLLTEHFVSYVENNFNVSFDYIIPLPSYNPKTPLNKEGTPKIMYIIGNCIAENLSIPLDYSSVTKLVDKEAKNGSLTLGDFHATKIGRDSRNLNILLIDDLFGEGNSANLTIEVIKAANPTARVYFISATNNKYGGLGKDVMASINFSRGRNKTKAGNNYIVLNFRYNGIEESCYIYDSHESYTEVNGMFDILDTNEISLKVKRNTKGYWTAV